MSDKPQTYGDFWDKYVERYKPTPDKPWPGDEWANEGRWRLLFEKAFVKHLPPNTAFEIGPGSGKYALLFLEHYPGARVIAADISPAYLEILKQRCATEIAAGSVLPEIIGVDHDCVVNLSHKHGIEPGELDVLFSIDAMVHVDLQYLMAYWLGAAAMLRQGGKMIMTVADATSDAGFRKLIAKVPEQFGLQDRQTAKFEWLCPELVEKVLNRIGFSVVFLPGVGDCCFVATKT
jgi:predicted O-methyltransferase YrrM